MRLASVAASNEIHCALGALCSCADPSSSRAGVTQGSMLSNTAYAESINQLPYALRIAGQHRAPESSSGAVERHYIIGV